jgi:hypothetical protein
MTMFDPEKITFFAKTDARGQEIPFGIKAKDRQRHMYVVGKTGMGKSTLLENMAAQDIQNGEGIAFIDPHGSAAETLLEYVPEHRVKDVVYFAPFDINNPVSFNVMEDVGPDKRHLVVSGLMSTFKKIWVDAWSARMEYILTNALLVLIEYPDTTLLSVNRLFIDKVYRKQVVEYCKDPAVKSFWTEEFASYTDRFAAEALPAIQNKIGQFTGNPLIRNIIGQPQSSFDIRQIMDEKKILIMNLSKGLIGETNANLLGSMLTTRIYLAAMSRADLQLEQMRQMPNFYFYVDEFQSFANATFANILSEARKYHLNLIIAHQYIAQMEEEVRDAVFGNVGTTVSFRVGPFDGEVLETVFAPRFEATDLVNLGFAQIYLTLMIDGIGSQPFSAVTLPPIDRPSVSCREMVIEASRKNFARDRESVERVVDELHTPKKPESPPQNTKPNQQSTGSFHKNNGGNNTEKSRRPDFKDNHSKSTHPDPNHSLQKPVEERVKKPSFPEKSPEDLRAILSKMTAENQPKNNPVTPKPDSVDTSTQPKKVEQQKTTPTHKSHKPQSQPLKDQTTRKNCYKKNPEATSQHTQERKPAPQNHQHQTNQKPPASDLKSALAEALKQVQQTPEPKIEESHSTPRSKPQSTQSNNIFTPRHIGIDTHKQPVRESTQNSNAAHRPVSDDVQPSQPAPAKPAPAKPAPTELEQKPEMNPATEAKADSIDPQVIKKMLRHNDQERTPFQ